MVAALQNEELVKSARYRHGRIEVRFNTGIKEVWISDNSIKRDSKLRNSFLIPNHERFIFGDKIPISREFQFFPTDEEFNLMDDLICVKYKKYKKSKFIPQRLIVHEIVNKLAAINRSVIAYPKEILYDDMARIIESPLWKYQYKDILTIHERHPYKRGQPGQHVAENFSDWVHLGNPSIADAMKDKWSLYQVVVKLLRKKRDVSIKNVTSVINHAHIRGKAGVRFVCPGFYRALFDRLGISDMSIADPSPGYGSKAMACAIERCRYHFGETSTDINGIMDLFQAPCYKLSSEEHYDVALLDPSPAHYHSSEEAKKVLERWKDKADIKLIMVDQVDDMPKPDDVIEVITKIVADKNSKYLAVYY